MKDHGRDENFMRWLRKAARTDVRARMFLAAVDGRGVRLSAAEVAVVVLRDDAMERLVLNDYEDARVGVAHAPGQE